MRDGGDTLKWLQLKPLQMSNFECLIVLFFFFIMSIFFPKNEIKNDFFLVK